MEEMVQVADFHGGTFRKLMASKRCVIEEQNHLLFLDPMCHRRAKSSAIPRSVKYQFEGRQKMILMNSSPKIESSSTRSGECVVTD
ncbi:unnamed protein product [Notodromas monacha]|uniref:Uncharacterized protein n=1 Tax=Notodromas monacha TaxID=399045 RepID=A0A7R9BEM0_9CRUS|nr:unnamed protein product [Notodromas monacha]CAG0913376.1 unnamed protein product [Notodromas monacha]